MKNCKIHSFPSSLLLKALPEHWQDEQAANPK